MLPEEQIAHSQYMQTVNAVNALRQAGLDMPNEQNIAETRMLLEQNYMQKWQPGKRMRKNSD